MLRIIHPNGAYTHYLGDEDGARVLMDDGATSDYLLSSELFNDLHASVAAGARVEVVADPALDV